MRKGEHISREELFSIYSRLKAGTLRVVPYSYEAFMKYGFAIMDSNGLKNLIEYKSNRNDSFSKFKFEVEAWNYYSEHTLATIGKNTGYRYETQFDIDGICVQRKDMRLTLCIIPKESHIEMS
jgi:hypothetical protein